MSGPCRESGTSRSAPIGGWGLLEVAAILGLFFVYAGCPPPDVNEAHYLAKAKHYWNPAWCADDLFLESSDAHVMFYWTFGWLTLLMPLPAVAWLVRLLNWLLLAWAWQRLSVALVPQRLVSVLTAAVFVALLERCHLAGEWIVGGAEAKGFAYVLVLCGLRAIVMARWRALWLWLGAASSFHVLVGGWSVVAALLAWLAGGHQRPRFRTMLPYLIAGLVLALPGLLPVLALSAGVEVGTARLADKIYVLERLSHHLVFHCFAVERMWSFGILIVAWGWLSWLLRREDPWRRLNRFTVGAMPIALCGIVLDILVSLDLVTVAWLRFYWFRLSDVAVALCVATAIPLLLKRMEKWSERWAPFAWATLILIVAGFFLHVSVRHHIDFRPRADAQSRPATRHTARFLAQRFEQWRAVCRWIAENTQPQDRFLTPRDQQTFKWYAGRSEVVSWKDIPQDPATIGTWWQLRQQIYPPRVVIDGLGALTDEELRALAIEHRAEYILVDRSRTKRRLGFRRVWANPVQAPGSFELYAVH